MLYYNQGKGNKTKQGENKMKTILINSVVYILNENIITIKKDIDLYASGKKRYVIIFEYINGTIKKSHFETEEEQRTVFDEIYTIMKEK